MAKKVLIISSSPRKGGNSAMLCDEFMKGVLETGNEVEKASWSFIVWESRLPQAITALLCGMALAASGLPGLFTGSLGWEMLTIKASVLYLAYFFLYGCVM